MSFITDSSTPLTSILAGSSSGLLVRFFISPIDVVKIRLQLSNHSSLTSTVYHIFRKEGIRAFWKGNIPAELLYVIYGASQFTSFTIVSNVVPLHDGPLKDMIVGATAGSMATVISYPFDLLRTRLASYTKSGSKSLLLSIREIWKENGPLGFFKGCQVGIGYISILTGISFGSYSFMKRRDMDSAVAGGIAGLLSKTFVYPLDLIKRRLQIKGNLLNHIKQIYRINGFRGFYRGLSLALLKSVPSTALSLYFYEFFTKLYS